MSGAQGKLRHTKGWPPPRAGRCCSVQGLPGENYRSRYVELAQWSRREDRPRKAISALSASDKSTGNISYEVSFRCPVCGQPLRSLGNCGRGGSLRCETGHEFARAKEGHVNLLRSGRKPRKNNGKAGDEDGMVRARRDFFDAGHFSEVAEAVAELVAEGIQAGGAGREVAVLDAGCGEGHYIGRVRQELLDRGMAALCYGLDISALAVRLASRRHHPSISFAVGNAFDLPFHDKSLDCVLTVFSPWPAEEFRRVLRPGGFVLAAGPGPDHLFGLKALLYGEPRHYQPREFGSSTVGGAVKTGRGAEAPPPPEAERRVRMDVTVSGEDASNLLRMTPYWWKAKPEQQASIAELPELSTPLEVLISRHRYPAID